MVDRHFDNKEIESLANSMSTLAVLFKELSTLVVEQGTIVDRIDYNIESALVATKSGRGFLTKARKA